MADQYGYRGVDNILAVAQELVGRGANTVGCIAQQLQDANRQDPGAVSEDQLQDLLIGALAGDPGAVSVVLRELAVKELPQALSQILKHIL